MAEVVITVDANKYCAHVSVLGAKSERSAVQLARKAAERHYGMKVDHYVSSGCTLRMTDEETEWRYVYSDPRD
jgi:hypothetical protein